MDDILKESKDFLKENYNNLSEVIKERVFSPMYFYFIIAWIITNWQFLYAFFFLDPKFVFESQKTDKISFLESFYSMDLWLPAICSVAKLVVIPAISAFIIVWWFSKLSEAFYEKTEKHKQNKRAIKKAIEYTEEKVIKLKISYAKEAFDKQENVIIKRIENATMAYNENIEFNTWFDDTNGDKVQIGDLEFFKSEILYYTDFESYRLALNEWRSAKEEKINNFINQKNISKIHDIFLELQEYSNYLTNSEIQLILEYTNNNPKVLTDEDVKQFISDLFEAKKETLEKEIRENLESLIFNS